MKLPVVSGRKLIKFLRKKGFVVIRQKGSHVTLFKEENNEKYLTVVPLKKEMKIGTLISILKQANVDRKEFLKEFKK